MTVPIERRTSLERRHPSLVAYWHGARLVRRKAGRRQGDCIYAVVDWHSPRVSSAALAIMVLCCCDGLLTIELLGRGAVEANPAMAMLMQLGMGWFSSVKVLLTAIGVVVLVACSSMRLFRRVSGAALLYGLLTCYLVLIAYEFVIRFA